MNRMVLSATLVERAAPRHTPAGLPALDLGLHHASTVSEDGQPRKVAMELRAVAIGTVTQAVFALPLGAAAVWAGFLAGGRNGRGLLFHVTSVAPDALPETRVPDPLIS